MSSTPGWGRAPPGPFGVKRGQWGHAGGAARDGAARTGCPWGAGTAQRVLRARHAHGPQGAAALNSSGRRAKAGAGRDAVTRPIRGGCGGGPQGMGPLGPRTAPPHAAGLGQRQQRARGALRPPAAALGRRQGLPCRGPRDSLGKPSREGIPAPAWSQRWSRAPETAPGCEQGPAAGHRAANAHRHAVHAALQPCAANTGCQRAQPCSAPCTPTHTALHCTCTSQTCMHVMLMHSSAVQINGANARSPALQACGADVHPALHCKDVLQTCTQCKHALQISTANVHSPCISTLHAAPCCDCAQCPAVPACTQPPLCCTPHAPPSPAPARVVQPPPAPSPCCTHRGHQGV